MKGARLTDRGRAVGVVSLVVFALYIFPAIAYAIGSYVLGI